jgi:hypothetical protein
MAGMKQVLQNSRKSVDADPILDDIDRSDVFQPLSFMTSPSLHACFPSPRRVCLTLRCWIKPTRMMLHRDGLSKRVLADCRILPGRTQEYQASVP